MSYPTPYTRDYGFTGFQSGSPTTPLPATKVDQQLDEVSNAQIALLGFLKTLVRADGSLNSGVVGFDNLNPVVSAAIDLGLPGRVTIAEDDLSDLEATVANLSALVTGSPQPGPFVQLSQLPVRTSQFLAALVAIQPNAVSTLNASIPASKDDPLRIVFEKEPFCPAGSVLAAYAQNLFKYNDATMAALFSRAAGIGVPAATSNEIGFSRLPTRLSQFLLALSAGVSDGTNVPANPVSTITAAVAASADDAINIAFNHGGFLLPTDALAAFIQTTLGLTASQMALLFAAARTKLQQPGTSNGFTLQTLADLLRAAPHTPGGAGMPRVWLNNETPEFS